MELEKPEVSGKHKILTPTDLSPQTPGLEPGIGIPRSSKLNCRTGLDTMLGFVKNSNIGTLFNSCEHSRKFNPVSTSMGPAGKLETVCWFQERRPFRFTADMSTKKMAFTCSSLYSV